MAWQLCDYAEVLALAPAVADRAALKRERRVRATLFTSSSPLAGPAAPGTVPEGAGG
jgi:hypothetical protein